MFPLPTNKGKTEETLEMLKHLNKIIFKIVMSGFVKVKNSGVPINKEKVYEFTAKAVRLDGFFLKKKERKVK